MDDVNSLPLIFECNEIYVNDKDYWDEIIQLTFVKNENENISFTRLSYEEDIYIEHNDQINFIYAFYKNVNFNLGERKLSVNVIPGKKMNMPNAIEIVFSQTIDNLEEILRCLKAPTICI